MLTVWRWATAAALGVFLLAGCVTTESGGFDTKKDPHKALELSVQAARDYMRQGNWEAAKRHLKTALDLDDRDADVHETMALVFWKTGEIEQAEQHFRRAIGLDGKSSRIRNNYAAFLFQQQRYADAEAQLDKVAEDLLYEKRAEAFVNLGLVRIKLKNYAGAKDVLERARLMDANNLVTVFALSEVYYQLGDFARAQEFYAAYRRQAQAQTPESLWLGIRLADKFGDQNARASYALALKNLYPRSEEYLEYKSVYDHGGQP